ncbi:hypothetical protein [uncultured Sutterella sp.]|uniref:hypothetical protein n=1 Tax=uncultured Sutterella sp. TaxID=286133 RepID=UPI0026302E91|nr:hypothetical protein [uncultured Sutterella sp.]
MNTKSGTKHEEEEAFLSTTPETIYFGRHEVKLSRAARLMRSLNRLQIRHRQAAASELGITPTIALEGEDELAGEAARTMNAAALRPLEFPEGSANAFESFGTSNTEDASEVGEKKPVKPAFKPLTGSTFAISGNISLEGTRSFTCSDLRDEKLLHTARPVLSLMEAGASLSMVANCGEMLGLLSPQCRGFTARSGSPVNPCYPETSPEVMSPLDASASLVAVGAVSAALVLGRASDAASAAIRCGMTSFRPSLGVFTSTEGFVHSWRYAGWGTIASDAVSASVFSNIAALNEGVSDKPGCGPWEFPGYRPMLMGTEGVAAWRHEFMTPVSPKRVLFAVGESWKTPEREKEIRRLSKGFADKGIEVEYIDDLPEEAPEIEWLSWAEFGPVLENYFERAFPLSPAIRTDRFLMLLTLSERVKLAGFDAMTPLQTKRFVELVRREPELLSPWAGTIIRNRVMPLKTRFENLFRGKDRPDAVIWFGGSPAVDMAEGAIYGIPLLDDKEKKEFAGAFLFGAPREDARALGAAVTLESLRAPAFASGVGRITIDRPDVVFEKDASGEADEPETDEKKTSRVSDAELMKDLSEIASGSTVILPASAAAHAADETPEDDAGDDPMDSEEFSQRLRKLVGEFREALSEAAEDDQDIAESAAASTLLVNSLMTGEEIDAAETDAEAKPEAKKLPAVSPEDAAWLAKFMPDSRKRCPEIAKEKFLREIFTDPMPEKPAPDDSDYILQFGKYWLMRHERHKAQKVLERIPEANRTFAVEENLVMALFLGPDVERSTKAAEALKPATDSERARKEWILGLNAQRLGDKDAAVEHFRTSHNYAPADSPANFPLALLILEREGVDSDEYKALKEAVKREQPSAYKLLLSDEERLEKEQNFEQELLPELPVGVFAATLLMPREHLRLNKDRFLRDLSSNWNLSIIDRTPEDPETFTFRIGYLTGTLKCESGKVPDTSLEQAARKNIYTRDAEALLLNHAGRINLRLEAGTTPLKDAASLFAQLLASACRSNEPLGVYLAGVLQPANYCIDAARPVSAGAFPTLSVVSIFTLEDFGTPYISTYGLTTIGHPEIEIDLDGLPFESASMLVYSLLERIVNDQFEEEAQTIRFGLDPENLTELDIRRAPGRNVATEVLLFTRKGEEEEVPQA